jgi:AcrR family transcriptional regulator
MNREEKSREVRNRIIDTARDLMITNGYRETTIRHIIEQAGVNTGSLYHFFRDKEEILLQIVIETYNEIMEAGDRIAGNEKDTELQYALIYALEMKAVEKYDRVAKIYLESYSSWRISQVMLPLNIERNRLFFHRYNKGFTDTDYYLRTLLLRGMRLSIITERIYSGFLDFDIKCPLLISTGLTMFNVPKKKIEAAVERALELVKQDALVIHGFNI